MGDSSAAEACMSLHALLDHCTTLSDGLPKDFNWKHVRMWENFEISEYVKDLLDAKWDDYTEVDLLAMKAADSDLEAVEHLRQLLCVSQTFIPLALRTHMRRVIVKYATPFMKQGQPPLTRPRILRALLHIIRNSMITFWEAKEEAEAHFDAPLCMPRRKAVIAIGELACQGHELACNYLLDTLCQSKDWSTRQLALGRAARALIFASHKDKGDIARVLLKAVFNGDETPVVRETAETLLIESLRGALHDDTVFIESFVRLGTGMLPTKPRGEAIWCREVWERIKMSSLSKSELEKAGLGKHRHSNEQRDVKSLRDSLCDGQAQREQREMVHKVLAS